MISRNKIKLVKSLQLKKQRHSQQAFIIEGTKLFTEAIRTSAQILETYVTRDWLNEHAALVHNRYYDIVSEKEMNEISQLATAPGLLAIVAIPACTYNIKELEGKLSLALDGINDPGNLGSMIRSAEWFGVEYVFCSEDTVDVYNPKVVQATMGSIFRVKTIEMSLTKLFQDASSNGIKVMGAMMEGENIFKTNLANENELLVIGSESHGIRDHLLPFIQKKITIPAYNISNSDIGAESLNAAIAASIILSGFRMKKNK